MKPTSRYRCMVVDDESHAIELLSDYIEAIPQLHLVKVFQDPVAALLSNDSEENYDFIFLDIDMPRLSGIELAKALRPRTRFLVFTTAHPKYALDAFDVRADHYLLKPIGINKFAVTIDRLLTDSTPSMEVASAHEQAFFIKSDQKNKFIKICLDDIIAVEGLKNYVILFTNGHKHVAYLTMKEMESALGNTNHFMRVHKSYIVAKKYIEGVSGRMIRMKANLEVPIGETYRQIFYDYLSENVLLSSR